MIMIHGIRRCVWPLRQVWKGKGKVEGIALNAFVKLVKSGNRVLALTRRGRSRSVSCQGDQSFRTGAEGTLAGALLRPSPANTNHPEQKNHTQRHS
jgi:hypothetical protein